MNEEEIKTYQSTNDTTQVENGPEPGKVSSLGSFVGIRQHNGSLSSPQQTGTNTEESAGKDTEACGVVGVNRDQESDGINAVANSTE